MQSKLTTDNPVDFANFAEQQAVGDLRLRYVPQSREINLMQLAPQKQTGFVDRRDSSSGPPGVERRQFSSTPNSARPEVNELAKAVDNYKLRHRRRFITYEELFDVMESLGYHR